MFEHTLNRYEALKELRMYQHRSGVEPAVAEIVIAYARLKLDSGNDPFEITDTQDHLSSSDRSYLSKLQARNPKADPRFLGFLYRYAQTMSGHRLPVIFSVAHLAKKLHISEKQLCWLSRNQGKCYHLFSIPKADGRERIIAAPTDRLRTFQRWIYANILYQAKPHKYATAFIPGKSTLDNASVHAGRECVIRVDLENFFPSIEHRDVRKVFERLGYPYQVATMLANLCTLEGRLPQGAHTSPALSNLVCVNMDRRFAALGRRLKFRYSRYADDMIFSSNNPKFTSLIPFIREVIRDEGFVINDKKLLVMRGGHRKIVTGIVVNDMPSLPRDTLRRLRAAAHRLRTRGPESLELASRHSAESDPLNVFRGHVSYANMVCPEKVERLKLFPEFSA